MKKIKRKGNAGCAILIVLFLLYFLFVYGCDHSGDVTHLQANIQSDGEQIQIQNNDSFDWTQVVLMINSGFSDGYYIEYPRIGAGENLTVDIMQFAKSNGERFNPLVYKAKSFNIRCQTPKGLGVYLGE